MNWFKTTTLIDLFAESLVYCGVIVGLKTIQFVTAYYKDDVAWFGIFISIIAVGSVFSMYLSLKEIRKISKEIMENNL